MKYQYTKPRYITFVLKVYVILLLLTFNYIKPVKNRNLYYLYCTLLPFLVCFGCRPSMLSDQNERVEHLDSDYRDTLILKDSNYPRFVIINGYRSSSYWLFYNSREDNDSTSGLINISDTLNMETLPVR